MSSVGGHAHEGDGDLSARLTSLWKAPTTIASWLATVDHKALGLRYIHIPVDFKNPTEADFKRFQEAIDEVGDAPVHIHCAANYRVSAFLYRYRRAVLGWTEEEARPDLDAIWAPDSVWEAFLTGDCER